MHSPEHFLTDTGSTATTAAAAALVAVAAHRARREHETSGATLPQRAALVAATSAFIFGSQMLNFPLAQGTSGHMMGAALAAALLGPWTGLLVVTMVLAAQSLAFADGGVTSLGLNTLAIGAIGVAVGWAVSRAIAARTTSRASLAGASALGAALSVPAAALGMTTLWAAFGSATANLGAMTTGMLTWHLGIGVVEGAVTGLTIAAVAAVAPGAIYLTRAARPGQTLAALPAPARLAQASLGLGITAVVAAGALARLASPHPDGMEFVTANLGADAASGAHTLVWGLAEYGDVAGVDVGLAGVIGVLITAALGAGIAALSARTPQVAPAAA